MTSGNLSPEQMSLYKHSWATCTTSAIPDLFSAYHRKDGIAKRISAFYLDRSELPPQDELSGATVQIHMACDPELSNDKIHDKPRFFPILAFVPNGFYYRLQWDEVFDGNIPENNQQQVIHESIGKRTMHELLTGWCLCKHQDLSAPFEGLYFHIQQRVVFYEFTDDSQQILEDIYKAPQNIIRVVMGVGHPMGGNRHPFSFRPILQVGTSAGKGLQGQDGEECQYEFSYPCPPVCGDK